MKNYNKEIAVVTGAAGTLCSVIAEDLGKKGARVALLDRNLERIEQIAEKIRMAGGECKCYVCDVTDESSMQAVADQIRKEWGLCRYLINGAGGNNIKAMTTNVYFDDVELTANKPEDMRGFFDLQMEDFERVLKLNTMGTVIPSKVFARHMAEAKKGAIINFASMNSYRPLTRVPAYAMSKAAVVNLTQWLATYFAKANIRVNAIAPGFFVNERSKVYLGTVEEGLTQRGKNVIGHTPAGRFGNPEDLLGTLHFLLGDDGASFVTGITIPVDGGFLSHSGI